MIDAVRIQSMPGITPLYQDYIYRYREVSEFYNGDFRDENAYQRVNERVLSRRLPRRQLAEILKEQNQSYGCGKKTLENIDALMGDDACAVVTGQQVGLFSGPLYTIYKSLTAILLSEHLKQNLRGRVVPVFWLASDDHDFAEINHMVLLNKKNQIEKICYQPEVTSDKVPAAKIFFTSEIQSCIQRLEELTHDSEFKQEVLAHLSEAYQQGRTFPEAFAIWMTRLFKSYGLVFMDATHPGLKDLGKKVFWQEIAESSPSTQLGLEASERLSRAGYGAQVQLHEGVLNLFMGEQERKAIQIRGSDFIVKNTRLIYEKNDILDLVEKEPQVFSPNVLLRSLYQDTLLPTVAYVGGPSEIAYFAQMKGIYEKFGLPMPVIYPRKTVTLVENTIANLCNRYELHVQDVWKKGDLIFNEAARKQIPDSFQEVIQDTAEHLKKNLAFLKQDMTALDPTLGKIADASFWKIDGQLKFLERKVVQASKKRNAVATRQLQKVKNNLYPAGRLQERVFNITPFLMKYSHSFIGDLYRTIDRETYDHQIIRL